MTSEASKLDEQGQVVIRGNQIFVDPKGIAAYRITPVRLGDGNLGFH
jgi:hypothetical protein